MNPWLPPCERVGGERHANQHLRSSRPTVGGKVRWREVGGLLGGSSVARTTGLILRRRSPAVANSLVPTKVDADPAPSAEQSTTQGPSRAAHLHPSGVAAGDEPLTIDRRPSAVLWRVLAGRRTPYVPQLWGQLPRAVPPLAGLAGSPAADPVGTAGLLSAPLGPGSGAVSDWCGPGTARATTATTASIARWWLTALSICRRYALRRAQSQPCPCHATVRRGRGRRSNSPAGLSLAQKP